MGNVLGPCLGLDEVASASEPIRFRWLLAYAATVIAVAYVAVVVAYGRLMIAGFPLLLIDGVVRLEVITLWISAPMAYALGRVCGDGPKRTSPRPSLSMSAAGLLGTALFLVGLLRAAGIELFQTARGWELPCLAAPLLAGLLLCGVVHHRAIGWQRAGGIASGVLIAVTAVAVGWLVGSAFAAALVPLAARCLAVVVER